MADRAGETTLIGRGSEKAHSHIPSHPPSSCTLLHNSNHNGVVRTINKPFLPAKHYLLSLIQIMYIEARYIEVGD